MLGFLFKSHRRRKLLETPPPAIWLQIIDRNVGVFRLLSPQQRQQLLQFIQVIVHERSFVGGQGLIITDEIKLTIAAQASLLLLGEKGYYFDRVPTVFVYPSGQTVRSLHPVADLAIVSEGVPVDEDHCHVRSRGGHLSAGRPSAGCRRYVTQTAEYQHAFSVIGPPSEIHHRVLILHDLIPMHDPGLVDPEVSRAFADNVASLAFGPHGPRGRFLTGSAHVAAEIRELFWALCRQSVPELRGRGCEGRGAQRRGHLGDHGGRARGVGAVRAQRTTTMQALRARRGVN